MARSAPPVAATPIGPRMRRTYFESRFGQLHVHGAMPGGGGFDEATTLYWLYYSFFYLSTKATKPALYDLCVRSLNQALEA